MHADVQVTQCCANNAGKAILSKGLIAGYNSVLGEAGKHVVDIPDANAQSRYFGSAGLPSILKLVFGSMQLL